MTGQEFFEAAGYFANPTRNTRIEIEARQVTINSYSLMYNSITGSAFPLNEDSVTVLNNNANKWGREMRLYFVCTDRANVPESIAQLMTVGGRPGYEIWDQRLNSRDIIDELFGIGFRLGDPQNIEGIRALIPEPNVEDFNRGFNTL